MFGRRAWFGVLACTVLAITSAQGCGKAKEEAVKSYAKSDCTGAVFPTPATIESGEYSPLSRPLFVYVNTKALEKPEVAAFVKTLLYEAQEKIEEVGQFIKLNATTLKEQQEKLNAAIRDVKIPAKLESGTVVVDGSSTVFPFSVSAAELFQTANDNKVNVNVGKKGTGGGLKRFIAGEVDICNASRAMQAGEVAKAKEAGLEYLELTVCIDGLTVCVNSKNDWCDCLSVEQLKQIWAPGSTVKLWSDLDPTWPKETIKLYGPDNDSGTFDYFTEVVNGKSKSSRSDYTPSSEDNVLVKGITGDKHALGYFGYSYYEKNKASLKALGIKPAKKGEGKSAEEKKPEEKKGEEKQSGEKK